MTESRTLTDADIKSIVERLYELLQKPKRKSRSAMDFETKPIDNVKKDSMVTKEWRLYKAACANVSPDNMMDQRMPVPMLKALLLNWEREHK